MAAGKYNFTIEQGVTFRKTITWTDAVGNPVNLTGYHAKMQLRDKAGGSVLVELDSTSGGITFNPLYGRIFLYISSTDTGALTVKRAEYDLVVTAPAGDTKRLLEGRVRISEEITE